MAPATLDAGGTNAHYGARALPNTVRILLAATIASVLGACAFGDLFQAAGPGDVRFVWVGDSVVTVGVAAPFQVMLLVDGAPASTPAVRVAIADTTVIAFDMTGDSIIGRRPGQGDVVAWIESSLAPRIDTVFRIRARP